MTDTDTAAPIEFHHGRNPMDPAKPKLRLAAHLTGELPAAPATADYLSQVPSWPMYGNDQYGDCVDAMYAHNLQLVTRYGAGSEVTLDEQTIVDEYLSQSPDDQGLVIQDELARWRKVGIGGHKIVAFAYVDPRDIDAVRAGIELFGSVLCGMNFPAYAMDLFNQGRPWEVSRHNASIEGGHAVPVGYYDGERGRLRCVTWAAVQEMSEDFWHSYFEEAWVVITEEWLNANGSTPTGLDLHGLGEDFAALTGDANPFPAPAPAPEPTPEPEPTPAPDPTPTPDPAPTPDPGPSPVPSADDMLAVAMLTWLRDKGYLSAT